MDSAQQTADFAANGHQFFLPHLSIDCVVFGYHDHQLKIFLVRYHGHEAWSLPGGFIKRDETLTDAANRILAEKTQITNVFLRQFHTFGDSPTRLNRIETQQIHNKIYAKVNVAIGEDHWLSERTLSIGYYALVDYHTLIITPEHLIEEYGWCDIDKILPLLFDHHEIIETALLTLRSQIYQLPIGYNLLPAKFTLPEIHALYEAVLGKTFDRRNFRKKLLTLGLVRQLDEQRKIGAHRSPFLYEFDLQNYHKALEQGAPLAY
ncbi:NUDIX hydrolase [Hymenobacter norwichensis]|uniref:NUDIX hydrolase n=1 Tax=Hymenobacter norwichensis TaxID=223903 RepID=UPI0003B76733|nr:NUDIX domain-containing protein [Hymenobacter norwichensis]